MLVSRCWACYLAPLIIGPIILLLTAVAVIPSSWYTRMSGDEWLIGMGYGATLHHANCQIVVFGDSTGEVAVNPKQLTEQTGLSACNISENEGLQIVNGQAVLNTYLAQNAPPKYLVMMQSPDSFDLNAMKGHGIGEGITYLMRQPDLKPKIVYVSTHPSDLFNWSFLGLATMLHSLRGTRLTDEQMTIRDRTGGQFLISDEPAKCNAAPFVAQPNHAWIQSIRSRYGINGTRVLIDAMPVPDCDPDISRFHAMLDGIVDNGVQTLPLVDYFHGGRHVNAKGSRAVTAMIASQVCQNEHSKTCGAQ
jgi:hypothetical protein